MVAEAVVVVVVVCVVAKGYEQPYFHQREDVETTGRTDACRPSWIFLNYVENLWNWLINVIQLKSSQSG